MWDRRARLVSDHDGDTITAVLDQGFGDTKQIKVRLLNVYAPELKQTGGVDTKNYVMKWFTDNCPMTASWQFVVTTHRLPMADGEDMSFDRYVATVTTLDGSKSLNADVEAYVTAQGYPGGTGS